jgi:hypothetical protein
MKDDRCTKAQINISIKNYIEFVTEGDGSELQDKRL